MDDIEDDFAHLAQLAGVEGMRDEFTSWLV